MDEFDVHDPLEEEEGVTEGVDEEEKEEEEEEELKDEDEF